MRQQSQLRPPAPDRGGLVSARPLTGFKPEARAPMILDAQGRPITSMRSTAYEAADRTSRELASWNVGSWSGDGALLGELETLRDRTEDMIRNHGIASGAVQIHLDNIIGPGLLLDARPDRRALGLKDDERADELDEFENLIESKFENYVEDLGCYIDASRRSRFSEMCAIGYRSYLTSFEILGTAEWLRRPGTPYRTAIQLIDPARLCNPDGRPNSDRLRAGVAMDDMGAPIGYWFVSHLMSDGLITNQLRQWKYVPREMPNGRANVIHIYDQAKAGQTRGQNGIVSILAKLKMLEKFEKATLQAAILNAMYAAVIQSSLDWESVAQSMGAGENDPTLAYLGNRKEWHEESNVRFNGVKIPHLFPGEELKLLSPEHPNAAFNSFEEATLRYIAAGFNLTYEQLSRDYSKTNYSSARAAMLEAWRFFSGKQYTVAGKFASMVYQLWFEEAVERGELVLPAGLPGFYEAKSAWTRCHWIGPGRGHIDPLKEANATKVELSMGLSTMQIEAGLRGRRWQDLIDQSSQEERYMKKRGIDPERFRGQTPVAQPPDQPEDRGPGEERDNEEGQQSGESSPPRRPGAGGSVVHVVNHIPQPQAPQAQAPQPVQIEVPGLSEVLRSLAATNARVSEIAERSAEMQASLAEAAEERHAQQTRVLQQTIAGELAKPTVLIKDAKGRTVGARRVDHIEGAAT